MPDRGDTVRLAPRAADRGEPDASGAAALPAHGPRLFRAAYALAGSRPDAEDLVQETYARVLGSRRGVRHAESLPYLMRALRNTWIDWQRSRSARPSLAGGEVVDWVVAVATFSGGGPGVEAVAGIGERPATKAAPDSDGTLLDREFEGVTFPDWTREFGWMAIGGRSDTVEGRRAETVFYTHQGHTIAYTVVEGDQLEPPEGATTMVVDGVTLHRFRDGERDVVTFERGGRTCVLAGMVLHDDTLPDLAAWHGDGAVDF